jgi:D-alanyl-D-alanine carboxypeptidase
VGTRKKRSINRLTNARRRRNRWLLVILIVASVLALGWRFVEGEEAEFRKVRAAEAPVIHPETQPLLPTVGGGEGPNGEDAQEATTLSPPPPAKSCDSLRVLVDPAHPLPPDYAPEDLVSLWAFGIPTLDEDMLLRREAAEHLSHLVAAAAADGEELVVASAYRSYLQQQGSYGRLTSVYGADAGRMSARPGRSQHQLGTAVDFTNAWVGYKLRQTFGVTSASWWLTHHAPEYGFVLAYPIGEETQTGYRWEPWHYRYVGVENAKRLVESGLSLQEFLEREGVLPRC